MPSMPSSNVSGSVSFGAIATGSCLNGPAITFSNSAVSETVRASGPVWQ